jgi:ABC-type multidrug transport system ATPase subunit
MSWGAWDVSVRFGDRIALEHVSMEAREGALTGVVGGEGAGKTTLLRALVGLVAPSDGEIGRPGERQVGYLASSSGTYPDLTVEENLAFAASAYGVRRAEIEARVGEYLERTGLAAARHRLGGELSGGMRQKLGVIRAMIHRPEFLVLDEPTTGIDPVSRADLWWLVARAAADGAAVVLATTYLDEAERASWLLVLDEGRALAHGTVHEIEAAMPGELLSSPVRPKNAAGRTWRRGAGWRVWRRSDEDSEDGGQPITPDLQDAVTVAALTREAEAAAPGGDRP